MGASAIVGGLCHAAERPVRWATRVQVGDSIIGKHILVGLTYLNDHGEVREQVQYHGLITQVSESTIVFERADGGGDFSIPFDPELDAADPDAIYTLSCSGERVTGVHLLSSWTIHPPEDPQ